MDLIDVVGYKERKGSLLGLDDGAGADVVLTTGHDQQIKRHQDRQGDRR